MKKNQPAIVLGALGLFASSLALAQNYQKMPIQSGLTADVIANGTGSSSVTTNNDVDGVSYAFVAKDFLLTAASTPITYGLPVDGIINSIVTATPGLSYQLGSLSANNSLRLAAVNDSGILTFTTPKAATKLYMLSTSGSGASTVSLTVNFSDGTNQQFTGISIADWYTGTNIALQGFGRIKKPGATPATGDDVPSPEGGTNPRLYQNEFVIDAANQTKLIQSVTVAKTAGSGLPNIFAFSVDAYSTCVPPTLQAAGSITANSATVSWTAPTGSTVASYDVYYSTSSTIPTSAATPSFPGVTGTSKVIPGLTPNTTYYYWVRTNCSTGTSQSAWSFGGTFKTACGAVTSMAENFDSYATGNIVPDCWVRNAGTGSMTISSSTPASGTRNIYQYVASTGTPSTVVLPEFSNINAGTHWLRLKAKVSSATGALKVGYVTTPTDASTFVLLQSLSLANTSYTNSEYTVIVPNTVPATARLAIQNTADGKSYYWDDVYWEPVPSCIAPTVITSSNVASFSATIGWTAPATAPANGYDVYYSTSNVAPTSSTVLTGTNSTPATTTSAQLTTLASSSTYYIWVRSNCSSTDKSAWAGPISITTPSFCPTVTAPAAGATGVSVTPSITWTAVTGAAGYKLTVGTTAGGTDILNNVDLGNVTTYPFTTSLAFNTKYYYTVNAYAGGQTSSSCTENNFTTVCTSTGAPYTLDFESVTTPALPGCTSNVNVGTGNNWTTADAPTDCPGFSTKVLRYAWNGSNAANTWFFTQGLNLTAGTQYTISYKYGNNTLTTYTEKLKVAFGTSATAAAMINPIADYPTINDKIAHTVSINFTVPTTGVYYFGFNAYSIANQYYLYVDDINVSNASLATAEVSANKNNVQAYPNPFTDVLNISDIKNVKSISVIDIAGRLIKNIESPSSTLHLGDLKQGVYLVVLNMNDGSKQTIKAIKK